MFYSDAVQSAFVINQLEHKDNVSMITLSDTHCGRDLLC